MRAAIDILFVHAHAALFGLVATLLFGCAGKGRESNYTTTIKRDTVTGSIIEETRTESHSSDLRATGYKLALEKIAAEERRGESTSQGPGDYYYHIGADSAEATPESQALKAFQSGLGVAAQFYGIRPAQESTNTSLSTDELAELRALLTEIKTERDRRIDAATD